MKGSGYRWKPYGECAGNPKVAITFDRDAFERIDAMARELNISFAAAVRRLVERGLE